MNPLVAGMITGLPWGDVFGGHCALVAANVSFLFREIDFEISLLLVHRG
jgi:hypothetical protein